jgi:hypothetical protein
MRRGTAPYIHPLSLIEATSCGSLDDAYALGLVAYESLAAELPWARGGPLDTQLMEVLLLPCLLHQLQGLCAAHSVRAQLPAGSSACMVGHRKQPGSGMCLAHAALHAMDACMHAG